MFLSFVMIRDRHVNPTSEQPGRFGRTTDYSKSYALSTLVRGILVLHGLAFILMLMPPMSIPLAFISLGISFSLHAGIYYLAKRGRVTIAANAFCHVFNLVIFSTVWVNILGFGDIDGAVTNAYLFCISIFLSGILIGSLAPSLFATLNTLLLVLLVLMSGGPTSLWLKQMFPSIVIFHVIGMVSWVHQRSLRRANAQLEAANRDLLRTELLRRDLEIARELQQQLYPLPPSPDTGLDIASRCEPARETSGDFYDFIEVGGNRLAVVVADVMGKSLPAALVMAMTHSTIRSEALRGSSPAAVLEHVNKTLCRDWSVKQIVTAFYGEIDLRTLELRCANAGHIFPLLKRNGVLQELDVLGLPLRAMPDTRYGERRIQLMPGDTLILISDGIVETMNSQRELFSFDRLEQVILRADGAGPHELLELLCQEADTFRGSAEQQDDRTLVIVKVQGPRASDVVAS